MGILMSLFMYLDFLIYTLISWMYNLIIDATVVTVLTDGQISDFASRVYSIMGIIMLFFVSYKVIAYLIDPEQMTAKGKGASSMAMRVFIAIVMTIAIPFMFKLGFRLQKAVINENIIGKIIYNAETTGTEKKGIFGNVIAQTSTSYDKVAKFNKTHLRVNAVLADEGGELKAFLDNFLSKKMTEGERFAKLLQSSFVIVKESGAIKQKDVTGYIMDDRFQLSRMPFFVLQPEDLVDIVAVFKVMFGDIWYIPVISTAAGIWCLFLMFSLFFDIVMRVIKLTFLQIVTPFFTAMYVLDDSGKVFNTWFKKVLSVYMMLFVRLFTIQLAMYMIGAVSKTMFASPGAVFSDYAAMTANYGTWSIVPIISLTIIRLTLIFALLYFAKIAPKFLTGVLGLPEGEESDTKGAIKWAKETYQSAMNTVGAGVGLAAAAFTGGASLAAIPGAMTAAGAGAAANGAGALAQLKASASAGIGGISRTRAVATGAYGAAKGSKTGPIEAYSEGIAGGKSSLEGWYTRKVINDEYGPDGTTKVKEGQAPKYMKELASGGEDALRKAATELANKKQEAVIKGYMGDAFSDKNHPFSGKSGDKIETTLADKDFRNLLETFKIAIASSRADAGGRTYASPAERMTEVSRIVKDDLKDRDVIAGKYDGEATAPFKQEYDGFVSNKRTEHTKAISSEATDVAELSALTGALKDLKSEISRISTEKVSADVNLNGLVAAGVAETSTEMIEARRAIETLGSQIKDLSVREEKTKDEMQDVNEKITSSKTKQVAIEEQLHGMGEKMQ